MVDVGTHISIHVHIIPTKMHTCPSRSFIREREREGRKRERGKEQEEREGRKAEANDRERERVRGKEEKDTKRKISIKYSRMVRGKEIV